MAVVAPSSPFDEAPVWRGLGWLAEHQRVRFDRAMFGNRGFLAGADARRRAELQAALDDPEVRGVVAARGGHGAVRLLEGLDLSGLRRAPKWLIGFSDVTALHVVAAWAGIASLHAPNLSTLGQGDAALRARYLAALRAPAAPRRHEGLRCLVPGRARGELLGGNLTVLGAALARWRPRGDVLLVLEDVTEAPYRLDRVLATLLATGALDRVRGVVLGDFTDCPPGRHGVPVERALLEALAPLRVPVAAGLPVGHGHRNEPLALGVPAVLDATHGTLEVGDSTEAGPVAGPGRVL